MPSKSKSQEEVIKEFIEIHGDIYDYSKVQYESAHKNITIVCSIHGDFSISSSNHKSGQGCKKCAIIKRAVTRKSNVEKTLISKFKEAHKYFYNYDKTVYNLSSEKVIITCPIHGDFEQTPSNHKKGHGCPRCKVDKSNKLHLEKAIGKLIDDFRKVHKDKYDYSKTKYEKCGKCVVITCPLHGDFSQRPSCHRRGRGCPKCGREGTSKYQQLNPAGWSHTNWQKAGENSINFDSFKVYIIRCWNEEEEFYKIGKTYKTVEKRFDNKNKMPYNYETVLEEVFENAKEASIREDDLKAKNRENKYLPSINFNGKQECFSKNPCTTKNNYIHL